MSYIGIYTHNPFFSWLSRKALLNQKENEQLCELRVSSSTISINWGALNEFNCQKKNIKEIKINLKNPYEIKDIEKKMKDFTEIDLEVKNANCYRWTVDIKITMSFEKFDHSKCAWHARSFDGCTSTEEMSKEFTQQIEPTQFASNDLNIEHKIANNTISFEMMNSRFSNCSNVNLLLECKADENDKSSKVFEVAGLELDLENIMDITRFSNKVLICRAKAFIVKDEFMNQRRWTDWFKTDGSEMSGSSDATVWLAASVTLAVLMIVSLATVIIAKRRNKR